MVAGGAFARRLVRGMPATDRSPGRLAFVAVLSAVAGLMPTTAVAQQAGSAADEAAPAPREAPARFLIAAIDVSGVTKLDTSEIERVVYPHLGPDRTNADVVAARNALQKAYAAKGYDAVDVEIPVQPNETFSQGIVLLAVHEAPLATVRVVDSKHHDTAKVLAQVPSLVAGQPVNLAALQRDVAQANRFPDRQITPKFTAGKRPGTVDVDLAVEDRLPIHANVELNNDNSPNTRRLRVSGTARYSNLWGEGHTLSITGALAPEDTRQSAVISASYNAPVIGTPWSFLLYGYRSNSNVAALGGATVLGNGYQVGVRAVYQLPSTGSSQSISFGPDFKSFKEKIALDGQALQPTRIRYVPFVVDYTASLATERSSLNLSLGVTGGLRVVRHDACFESPYSGTIPNGIQTCKLGDATGIVADQFTGRAIDASENFVHLNLDASYMRSLIRDAQVQLRVAGQLADSSLVTNEQFSLGGLSSVRGYYVSEAVGDDGVNGSIELRTPDLGPSIAAFLSNFRFLGFVDAGYARVRVPAAEQQRAFKLVSAGGGVRIQLFRLLTGEFVAGVPLRRGPISQRGTPRYSFSLKSEF